jgi:long-subunit acyl-CoA synthetase (AMP-forming)
VYIFIVYYAMLQGEYIAVEKLEGIYKKASSVEQVWVYGNSFKSTLVAVVVPKPDAIKDWAKANGKTGRQTSCICAGHVSVVACHDMY